MKYITLLMITMLLLAGCNVNIPFLSGDEGQAEVQEEKENERNEAEPMVQEEEEAPDEEVQIVPETEETTMAEEIEEKESVQTCGSVPPNFAVDIGTHPGGEEAYYAEHPGAHEAVQCITENLLPCSKATFISKGDDDAVFNIEGMNDEGMCVFSEEARGLEIGVRCTASPDALRGMHEQTVTQMGKDDVTGYQLSLSLLLIMQTQFQDGKTIEGGSMTCTFYSTAGADTGTDSAMEKPEQEYAVDEGGTYEWGTVYPVEEDSCLYKVYVSLNKETASLPMPTCWEQCESTDGEYMRNTQLSYTDGSTGESGQSLRCICSSCDI